MRSTVYPADAGTTVPEAVVLVNGDPVNATSVSMTSEIPSHLPAQVSGSGGISATTGTVDVEVGAGDVSNQVPTPWTGTTPSPGDTVAIDVGRDGMLSRVLTGIVDDASGSASGGVLSFGVTDEIRRLDNPVSIPPLARIMPPPTTDGSTTPMHVGLVSSYLVDRVLRACGFYATAPMAARCVLSVPLTGSTYPERGRILLSRRDNTWREQPYFSSSWHSPLGNRLYAEYEPEIGGTTEGNLTRPMEIIFSAGNTHTDAGRMECVWGNGAAIAVGITSAKSLTVQFTYPTDTSTRVTVFTATTAELGSWRHVSVRFEPNGDRTASITIRTNFGGYKKMGRASLPWWTETQPMQKVTIDLRGNNVGGFQVAFPARPSGLEAFTPTANMTGPVEMASLVGSPAITETPAIELLKEWSEAECAAMWIDDDGVFQWRNRSAFTSGSIAWEGTSLDDLYDYEWSHAADGARSSVVVEYKEVSVQRSNTSRLIVWQGPAQTMEPGDELEEIVSPPDDEAWIKVDGTPHLLEGEVSALAFNRGRGSWLGFAAYDKDGEVYRAADRVGYKGKIEPLGHKAWKVSHTWDGFAPAGVDHIKLATQDDDTYTLKKQWQGFNLPVLRAQCRLTFGDMTKRVALSGAPAWAPSLTHDVDWWVQDNSTAQSLAYWLAQQTVKPRPVVEGIRLRPDARLQLGDKIRVSDRHRTGTTITGVIIHRQHGLTHAQHEMTLSLLVTGITTMDPTLQEYDQAWSGATLGDRDSTWVNQSLAQFDADPLRR